MASKLTVHGHLPIVSTMINMLINLSSRPMARGSSLLHNLTKPLRVCRLLDSRCKSQGQTRQVRRRRISPKTKAKADGQIKFKIKIKIKAKVVGKISGAVQIVALLGNSSTGQGEWPTRPPPRTCPKVQTTKMQPTILRVCSQTPSVLPRSSPHKTTRAMSFTTARP